MKSKYLIVLSYGLELPIVFNPILDHGAIAGQLKVISAGFCYRCDNGAYSVFGESITLKKKSRPEDAEIIQKYLEKEI